MNASMITILLHVGTLISTLKDLEKTCQDALKGQNVEADLKQNLLDVLALVNAGVIAIPGLTGDQLAKVVADVQAAL